MATLQDILYSVNSYLDLEFALPAGAELSTRVNFADQAVKDAASLYRFKEFETLHYPSTSTLMSVTLPTNFRELTSSPAVMDSSSTFKAYPQVRLEEIADNINKDNDFCYLLGNDMEGHTLIFHNLDANATLAIQYQRFPSGLATLTDIVELADPEYVKQKVISYVLQSRSDDRFPQAEADAQRRLQNMVGRQMIQPKGGVNRTPTNQRFVMGEDSARR